MKINAGDTALALRQESANAFAGAEPVDAAAKVYDPQVYPSGVIQYSNPDDRTQKALTAGGLFDFTQEQTVRILGVRGLTACGDITMVVGDRDNTDHDVTVNVPATGFVWFNTPVPVLPSQVVKVSTASGSAKGFIDLYIVKGSWF